MIKSNKLLCLYHGISLQLHRLSYKYFGIYQICIFFSWWNKVFCILIISYCLYCLRFSHPKAPPLLHLGRMKCDVRSPGVPCIVRIPLSLLIRQLTQETNEIMSDVLRVCLRLSQQFFLMETSVCKLYGLS